MTAPRAFLLRALCLAGLAGVGGLAAPSTVRAQQLASRLPEAWNAGPLREPAAFAVRAEAPRRDHRWLGTAVGAAALGLAAGLEAAAACGNSESGPRECTGVTIGVGALGAVVGGTIGHFVGRAFKRG